MNSSIEASTLNRSVILGIVLAATLVAAPSVSAERPAGQGSHPHDREDATAPIARGVLGQLDGGRHATFWVVMSEQADLAPAFAIDDWDERGRWVYERLRAAADSGQAEVLEVIRRHGADYRRFWIVSAIRVIGERDLVEELASNPQVARIDEPRVYTVPDPLPGFAEATVEGVEWNVAAVGAPAVWSQFGVRGEGIVVANIDTGVQFDHPALAAQYRGVQSGGSAVHDYNWYDPSGVCGSPSLLPCDNHGHGSHTMGTMVGDDKATNQIGLAPGAWWIAAKGCESSLCSDFALLSSAQWMLAPTDLSGANPEPSLRPHVINNSWGGGGGDDWFMGLVDAWVAAGIFPQFSNGNNGPACGTAGSPGDYPQSYNAGAHAVDGTIGSFSSRGPSPFGGEVKPNIAAPGVNVRSSVPTDSYATASGTSMASPHVAATVALMWSAAPVLLGDVGWTRDILDGSAVDVADTTCGGDAADNNVWGEGRLDASAAVSGSPLGPSGFLEGIVSDDDTGSPIAGAVVRATGESTRTAVTDAGGFYRMRLPVGSYTVSASAFGYQERNEPPVEILTDETNNLDIYLAPAPRFPVQGHVTDTVGAPVTNSTVTILGTPLEAAVSDEQGFYRFDWVPEGDYDVLVEAGRCTLQAVAQLVVDGEEWLDITLSLRSDVIGYGCRIVGADFLRGNTPLTLLGDDAQVAIDLPFWFPFYDQDYSIAYVSTNGFLHFEPSLQTSFFNFTIPNIYLPQAAVYPFWDNLMVDPEGGAGVWRGEGFAPDGRQFFLVEWRNVSFYGDPLRRIDLEILLFDDGEILTQYSAIDPDDRERGSTATIGLENEDGTVGFQYSYREPVLGSPEFAVRYLRLPFGAVVGDVRDSNDGEVIEGALVTAFDHNGNLMRSSTTDPDGSYRLPLPVGGYSIVASATNYVVATQPAEIAQDGETVTVDLALDTGRVEVDPGFLSFELEADASEQLLLRIRNTGSAGLDWWIAEQSGGRPVDVRWLELSSSGGTLLPDGEQVVTVTASGADMMPGTYQVALLLTSTSGREPTLEIPVSLVMDNPGDAVAVNCGGGDYVDSDGAHWLADQEAQGGSSGYTDWGYTDFRARARSTREPIAETTDEPLFQSYIRRPGSYVFPVANGGYRVELSFAEVEPEIEPGDRVIDIEVEGYPEDDFDILGLDPGSQVYRQPFTAYRFTYDVNVDDGELEVSFKPVRPSQPAILNAIRIVQTSF